MQNILPKIHLKIFANARLRPAVSIYVMNLGCWIDQSTERVAYNHILCATCSGGQKYLDWIFTGCRIFSKSFCSLDNSVKQSSMP